MAVLSTDTLRAYRPQRPHGKGENHPHPGMRAISLESRYPSREIHRAVSSLRAASDTKPGTVPRGYFSGNRNTLASNCATASLARADFKPGSDHEHRRGHTTAQCRVALSYSAPRPDTASVCRHRSGSAEHGTLWARETFTPFPHRDRMRTAFVRARAQELDAPFIPRRFLPSPWSIGFSSLECAREDEETPKILRDQSRSM